MRSRHAHTHTCVRTYAHTHRHTHTNNNDKLRALLHLHFLYGLFLCGPHTHINNRNIIHTWRTNAATAKIKATAAMGVGLLIPILVKLVYRLFTDSCLRRSITKTTPFSDANLNCIVPSLPTHSTVSENIYGQDKFSNPHTRHSFLFFVLTQWSNMPTIFGYLLFSRLVRVKPLIDWQKYLYIS